jgi:hypothetical protein
VPAAIVVRARRQELVTGLRHGVIRRAMPFGGIVMALPPVILAATNVTPFFSVPPFM